MHSDDPVSHDECAVTFCHHACTVARLAGSWRTRHAPTMKAFDPDGRAIPLMDSPKDTNRLERSEEH